MMSEQKVPRSVEQRIVMKFNCSAVTCSYVFHLVVLREVGEPLFYHGVVVTHPAKEVNCNTLPGSRVKQTAILLIY